MANTDNPNGFRFFKSLAGHVEMERGYLASSQTIAVGDAIIASSGRLAIALSNSGAVLGVAASACTSSTQDDEMLFYPAVPWIVFEGQCSGTYARTIDYTDVDIEGTTGIMEINENATTEQVAKVLGVAGVLYSSEIGANTRVKFVWMRSQFAPTPAAL
jgi:hypothetical protein